MANPHNPYTGHAPIDVDPFIPTGICAVCTDVEPEAEAPENREKQL